MPIGLIIELTSEIERMPDAGLVAPNPRSEAAVISIDAMTASAPSKVALALRPLGSQILMPKAPARPLPRLLLVTGMSGAGKSTVLDTLEDMGWDVVDNLPADLLDGFVNGGEQCRMRRLRWRWTREPWLRPAAPSRSHPLDRGGRGRDPRSRLLRHRAHATVRRDPASPPAGAGPARRGWHCSRTAVDARPSERRRQRLTPPI